MLIESVLREDVFLSDGHLHKDLAEGALELLLQLPSKIALN